MDAQRQALGARSYLARRLSPQASNGAVAGLFMLSIAAEYPCWHFGETAVGEVKRQTERTVSMRLEPADAILILGGAFTMGSSDKDVEIAVRLCQREAIAEDCHRAYFSDEQPLHTVMVESFFLEATEVRSDAYMRCVEAGTCSIPHYENGGTAFDSPALPVTFVTWQQAADFCQFRGRRLPTEPEWEYAARGGTGRRFPWGNQYGRHLANHGRLGLIREDGSDGYFGLAPVGSFPSGSTPSGLLDMAGNVSEWVSGDYAPYAESAAARPHKARGVGRQQRVVRGGSFLAAAPELRATSRRALDAVAARPDVGFRCAWSLDAATRAPSPP